MDGKILVVEEDGIISAMKEKEDEPKEEDVEEQEMEAETPQDHKQRKWLNLYLKKRTSQR